MNLTHYVQKKVAIRDLEKELMSIAKENPHSISYGLVNMARTALDGRGRIQAGHTLVYLAKPEGVYFIDAQQEACNQVTTRFSQLNYKVSSSTRTSGPGVDVFQDEVFVLPLRFGPI